MSELIVFKHPEFGEMRTLTINDEPWVVGKDAALILGYKDTADALKKHVDEEDKMLVKPGEMPTLKMSNYGAYIINESGLYSLIMSSKLPGAKRFKHWVTSEVLPAIRKHGTYKLPETMNVFGSIIPIHEWNGRRVITFQDIDTAHQLPRGTSSRNFRENRERFFEGMDYFRISEDEQRRTGMNGMTLLTGSGYIKLTNFSISDYATDIRSILAEQYFADIPQKTAAPTTTEVTVSVANHSTLIQCASIMATCMEINRPNVLNILRHIVPDIDQPEPIVVQTESAVVEVPAAAEQTAVITSETMRNAGFDSKRLTRLMKERGLTGAELAKRLGISDTAISNWRTGLYCPNSDNRLKLCDSLGVARTYFDK